MQKKKLDELFREKFSDFKEAPDDRVWRAIEASLDKKEKKRMLPIWWQLGGIAAALAVTLLLLNPFSDDETTNEILVDTKTEVERTTDQKSDSTHADGAKNADPIPEALVESSSDAVEKSAAQFGDTSKNTKGKEARPIRNSVQNQHTVAELRADGEKSSLENKNLAETNAEDSQSNFENLKTAELVTTENPSPSKRDLNPLDGDDTPFVVTEGSEKEVPEENKKSIFDALAEQEEVVSQKETNTKWSAGPSIAPVYFNAIGSGSPVNSIFVPNSKSGNINFSYGVSVAYEVSKKVTLRSGIHKVDYGYDTEDVSFSSSLNAISSNGQLASIDYAPTSNTLIISSKKVASDKFSTENSAADVSAKSAAREGFMSQQLGYLELPVEVNYAVLDKKFGINLIGGVSSLFLIDNAVSLTAGELTTEIGEANNINALNFSANMGLGLNYKFSPQVRLNLEPIFKYQLNTFSEIDGTFRPYSIGVYSGLSFKF